MYIIIELLKKLSVGNTYNIVTYYYNIELLKLL